MKTLLVRNGDLVIGATGHEVVSGVDKIDQDLRHALREPMGSDPFHPDWGTQIDRFIGSVLDGAVAFDVRTEVARVIQNYVAGQREQMQRDTLYARRSRYSTDTVVTDIEDIRVEARLDRINVRITLRTLARTPVFLDATVGV